MLQGRPLYDTAADRVFFHTPQEWDTLMRALDHGNNILLVGPRGWGKTTLLRQAQLALRGDDERVAFVDANAADSTEDLVARVRDAVRGRPGASEVMRTSMGNAIAVVGGDPSPPPAGVSRVLFDSLQAIAEAPAAIVLVDASDSGDAVYGLMGRLRDTLWQMPHQWVVAVGDEDRVLALKPPADAFFDTVIQLQPLPVNALVDLLHKRGLPPEFEPHWVGEIAADANGNARHAVRAANDALVAGRPPTATLSARARLLEQASSLGRPHGMLRAELLDLRQASPSDETLQGRLGLTRGRITALLRELLEAGLVETDVERADAPGRPRTIYRPAMEP